MTIPYPSVLVAIRQQSAALLRQAFDRLTLPETVELGTFVGPARLQAVTMARRDEASIVLAEINRQAFAVTSAIRTAAAPPNPGIVEQIRVAIGQVAQRRRAGPLLQIADDATGTLSTPQSAPPTLSDADYRASARRQDVEVAAIKAVASVESAGNGFDGLNRPKILFEAHHFGPRSQNRFALTHPHLSLTSRERRGSRPFYAWDQYQRLYEAMLLDVEAALSAASWGKFQVMGFNHNGWPDVRSFVVAMYESEANHLASFEAYCNERRLMRFVRARNWLAFARGYNGARQEGYDRRMEAAYNRFSRMANPTTRR